jgi:hypothetical protein
LKEQAMDAIVDAGWRLYPAAALMVFGALLTVQAVRLARASWRRPLSTSMQPLGWMQAFRLTIIGLALVGIGAAWTWQIGWLLALSLAIGGEETLETSIAISALRRAPRPSGFTGRAPSTGAITPAGSGRPVG